MSELHQVAVFDVNSLPEWQLLVGADVAATPEAVKEQTDLEAEKRRTQCSLNCLTYLYEGGDANYAALTAVQADVVRLERAQFDELHDWFAETIPDEETYQTVQYIMLIHDLGKSSKLFDEMGVDRQSVDHDQILTDLLQASEHETQRADLVPTLHELSEEQQRLVKDVFRVQLNFGQFLQAEAPAAALEGVPSDLDPRAKDVFYIMHAMLDIAGVVGHKNPDSSVILNSPTYMSMVRAHVALANDEFANNVDRYDAYLGYRAEQFGVAMETMDEQQKAEAKAQVRLACMLRYATPEEFGELHEVFEQLDVPVKAILTTELNRDGINDRATLPYYAPAMLKALSENWDVTTACTYFAHALQEAHIADREARLAGQTGMVTAELGDLTRAFNQGTLEPAHANIRFAAKGEMLIPSVVQPDLANFEASPLFEGESLRGKRLLLVGMGGGSDGMQAAMLGKLLEQKYGAVTSGIVSVRTGDKPLLDLGRRVSTATNEITSATAAQGDWRFLEKILVEGDQGHPPVFMLHSAEAATVTANLRELAEDVGAEIVIGVDTGGDSLYLAAADEHSQVATTPDQDHSVLEGLAALGGEEDAIERTLSVVIAPGIDSPDYAREMLADARAARVVVDDLSVALVEETYRGWRMDGSASEEGRYGKTPFAWLKALEGQRGLTVLPLPAANVISTVNPWRTFVDIVPAMAEIFVMDAGRHQALVAPR